MDVVCLDFNGDKDLEFNKVINNFIEDKIVLEGDYTPNSVDVIHYFRKEGMKKINELNKNYKNVFSRSWTLESHFLASDYKLQNPNVTWVAEFSDPLRLDTDNNLRQNHPFVADEAYFTELNAKLQTINEELFGDETDKYFPEIKYGDELCYLTEYLPFLFADVVRFTNENQRDIILDSFPFDIKKFVVDKSEILRHPTLDRGYYYLKESSYNVNDDYLNFAYFGTYIGKRHLEYLFKPFEELKDEFKDKIRLHLFVPNPDLIKLSLKDLKIYDNIIIGDKIPFLEFLNLTTKMDILIVNDLLTKGTFDINPYLPSKFSDYLGSGSDIWFICEENSSLDKFESKFKSYIDDYDSSKKALEKIIKDKLGFSDIFNENIPSEHYYHTRLTNLNSILDDTYKQRLYWINQNNLSKNKLNKINSDVRVKNERIASLEGDCNSLRNDVNVRDERIASLEGDCDSLKDDVRVRDERINSLNNELDSMKNEVKNLNELLTSSNLEKETLNKEFHELHRITKDSFDSIEIKNCIINDKNKEIEYYQNRGNLFNRFISSPLCYLYLLISSKNTERKLNTDLYKYLKNGDWFNRGYYLNENKDLSIKWLKILSPELHYICHGFDENRLPNREIKEIGSKKDLLKLLSYVDKLEE